MEKVKVRFVRGNRVGELRLSRRIESEQVLEDTLVEHPELLMDDLTVVCRQAGAGGGILDLLGVDGDGRLALFELKREFVIRDAVAQVLDYASYLDGLRLNSLNRWITEKSGGAADFRNWYTRKFGHRSLESLKPIRIFLVGLDIDDPTERMLRYLVNNSGMDITLLDVDHHRGNIRVKWVNLDGAEYIDYPVRPKSRTRPKSRQNRSKEERLRILLDRARKFGVYEEFVEIRGVFSRNWLGASERISTNLTIGLMVRYHSGKTNIWWFVGIIPEVGQVRLRFNPWGIRDKRVFRNLMSKIPYEESWEHGVEFLISPDEWIAHKKELTQLIQDVYKGWKYSGRI